MLQETYNEIVREASKVRTRDCLDVVKTKFPNIPENTLGSIISQAYQRKMKSTHARHHSPEAVAKYYEEYLTLTKNSNRMDCCMELADKYDLSPTLMARLILEKYISVSDSAPHSKKQISNLLKNTCLIKDRVLSTNVQMCVLYDNNYGPLTDAVRHSIGQQYELKLKKELQNLGLPFMVEEQLRARGYDKTPDVKLEIPIAINGHVVNWIESKASFGDIENHKINLKDQFWSYWNRFGPGLVIYWFGFISELDVHGEKGILLRDAFPEDVTLMDPDRIAVDASQSKKTMTE